MRRAQYVYDKTSKSNLYELEGEVIFSESNIDGHGLKTLTLKLQEYDGKIWIGGDHRIDVGEKIRVYHDELIAEDSIVKGKAYEIFSVDGTVKYRCCESFCEFV